MQLHLHRPVIQHTCLGFHRVTLSRPYRSAIGASRDLSSTRSSASDDKPERPPRAACMNGLRPNASGMGRPASSLGQASTWGEFRRACDVWSATILRPKRRCQPMLYLDICKWSTVYSIIHTRLPHTQKCQAIIESPPPMIEALMCDGQPFHLLG